MEHPNRKTTRLPGYDYNTAGAYFLTICVNNRKCILSRIVGTGVLDGPKITLSPYVQIAERYLHQMHLFYEDIDVAQYVIMPNHIHILLCVKENGPWCSAQRINNNNACRGQAYLSQMRTPVPTLQNSKVSRFISTFKRFCNKEYGQNIWQRGSYDHIIRDQADFDKHLKYIYENPFGWEKDEFYIAEKGQAE